MSHSHHHKHSHTPHIDSLNKAFVVGIILNTVFVAIELSAGFITNSVGLISDAGHNLSDVAGLIIALFAFKLAKVHTNKRYTYGYKKSTILASLINAAVLLVTVFFIILESINKFKNPQPPNGSTIAIVAGISVIINAFTAWLFVRDKESDLNVKGAYLHMAMDALVSIGVVISGLVMQFTGNSIIDPIIGLLIAVIIIFSTWGLLRNSVRLALDGVPENIDIKEVKKSILATDGVCSAHHLHVWAMSTSENALTAHVVINDLAMLEKIKQEVKQTLNKLHIQHATLEFEHKDIPCQDANLK